MKKIYIILIVVAVFTLLTVLISCPNNATAIIPDDTDIVPGELPADPGEAGMATVEGIDSDNDGVRDDIQRYIALEETDEDIQAILTDYAIIIQKYMVSEEELELMENEIIADAHADMTMHCLRYLYSDNATEIRRNLEAVTINTKERFLAYVKADGFLGGQVFELPTDDELIVVCEKYLNN